MKKFLSSLLPILVLALAAGCQPKDASPLVVVTSPVFPPFTFKSEGRLVGHEIELAKAIARDLGRRLEIREMAFSNLLHEVASGRAHLALATITVTKERSQLVNFSRPYYKTGIVIVSPEDAPLASPEEARGKILGAQAGTLSVKLCQEVIGTKCLEYAELGSLAYDVLSGKIDGAVNDAPMARTMTLGENGLAITSPFLSDDKYGVAVNRKDGALLKAVNSTIHRLEKEGTLQKDLDKWFRISDESRNSKEGK